MQSTSKKRGFTLVELIVSIGIFVMITVAIYKGYAVALQAIRVARQKTDATALADEQLEIIRNLPYANVGLVAGVPAGNLPRFQTLSRGGVTFTSTTSIVNVLDVYDTRATGTSAGDYKLVQVEIGCLKCAQFLAPLSFTTTVAPNGLTISTSTGSIFIKVFNSTGVAVPQASVTITNASTSPKINIVDNANDAGDYQLIGAPTSTQSYSILVTAPGYSTDQTYPINAFGASTVVNPQKTIAAAQVTQASFSIDKISTLGIDSVTNSCAPAALMSYTISGTKLVATSPNVLKYSQSRTTSGSGIDQINNLEWDTYSLQSNDTTRYVSGTIPLMPLAISPGSSSTVTFILTPKNPSALLVNVEDSATLLPLSGASVEISNSSVDDTLTTGQGYWRQTDWSGGSGQSTWSNETQYSTSDGNINTSVAGQITLQKVLGSYVPSGSLISSTFDTGTSSNFYNLNWLPIGQPGGTGSTSVELQIATNNDNTTWNFTGPDGTAGTYYTSPNQSISSDHNGQRYVRYKVILNTANTTLTPTVSEVSLTYSSQCAPPGQVYIDGLSSGTYTVSVTRSGYTSSVSSASVPSNGYASTTVIMTSS